jgi:hypothetical protein
MIAAATRLIPPGVTMILFHHICSRATTWRLNHVRYSMNDYRKTDMHSDVAYMFIRCSGYKGATRKKERRSENKDKNKNK